MEFIFGLIVLFILAYIAEVLTDIQENVYNLLYREKKESYAKNPIGAIDYTDSRYEHPIREM
jgi:hypothetical protein